jgi:hypothetical protein
MLARILAFPLFLIVLAMAMFLPIVIFFAARAGGMVGYSAVLILAGIYPSFLTFLHLGWIEHVLVRRLQLPKLAGKFTDSMTDWQSPGMNAHIYLLRMVPRDWQLQADRPIYEKVLCLARRHQRLLAHAFRYT